MSKHIVYILISLKDNNLYVGCTSSLKKRIVKHTTGKVPATKNRRPLDLIYFEVVKNKTDAFQKERYYKSLWSSNFKKSLKKLNTP